MEGKTRQAWERTHTYSFRETQHVPLAITEEIRQTARGQRWAKAKKRIKGKKEEEEEEEENEEENE